MSERALLALFQEACAARGNWKLALSGAAVAQAEMKARGAAHAPPPKGIGCIVGGEREGRGERGRGAAN